MKLLKLNDKFQNGKFKDKATSVVINKGESNYLNYFLSRNKNYRLHGEVIKFAQSKTQTNFNAKMIEVMMNINSPVSKKLLYLNNRKRINSIFTNVKAFKSKKDSIVFDTPFGNKKNEIKVGRFARKIFQMNEINDFTDNDIEQFVTDFYSKMNELVPQNAYFKVVNGEEIRRCYHVNNYHSMGGTLGRSCMRYQEYQYQLELYVQNPEVEMLVLFNKDTDKVMGRAVIWNKSVIKDRAGNLEFKGKFMDRIYTNDSKDVALFFAYAEKHNIARKKTQSYSAKTTFVIKGVSHTAQVMVTVGNSNVQRPYLDTVAYVNGGTTLYNGYRL